MRRPWNITDQPVYSIIAEYDDHIGINICTYVLPISRSPKMYVMSIETGSHTLDVLQKSSKSVIQLLDISQSKLIRPLGKRSGYQYDKKKYLEDHGLLANWHGHTILKDCVSYLLVEHQWIRTTGDHELYLCPVQKTKTAKDDGVLMFKDLIDQKIIL